MRITGSKKSCLIVSLIRNMLAKRQMGFRVNRKWHKLQKHHKRGASTFYVCAKLSLLCAEVHCSVLSLEKNTGRGRISWVRNFCGKAIWLHCGPWQQDWQAGNLAWHGVAKYFPCTSQKIRQETRLWLATWGQHSVNRCPSKHTS